MIHTPRRVSIVLALLFLALHLPFLRSSLEDLDSINFALAIRDFDVPHHQPHPPGVPIYVAITKLVRAMTPSEATALSVTAVLAGALSVLALMAFYRRLDPDPQSTEWSIFATLLAATTPLFWFTAARPMNDMPGLAAAVGIQALTLGASSGPLIALSAFVAAVAVGLRFQVAWLTFPLIALALIRRPAYDWTRVSRQVLLGLIVGSLIWLIPLVWLSGGPAAYWQALADQATEDLTGIAMLWTTPTPRQLLLVLNRAFVAPWAEPALAFVVIPLAAAGILRLARTAPKTLATIAVAFLPYAAFDFLFQETATTRYSLPLVVPMAYLAVRGMDLLLRRKALTPRTAESAVVTASHRRVSVPELGRAMIVAGMAGANLLVAVSSLNRFSSVEAPAFRMLADMRALASGTEGVSTTPVLAMHRRQEFDLRRPMVWSADQLPKFEARLPSPPKREWLELVKFWNGGGRGDVWFLADPLRSDLALVDDPPRRETYRWADGTSRSSPWLSTLLGGVRPNQADWYVIPQPGWYLGEGWALTPEAAGVAREAGLGPGQGPILGWIRRQPEIATLMIGGRNLSQTASPARLRVTVDDRTVDESVVSPGFFLKVLPLPSGLLAGTGEYAALAIEAVPAAEGPGPDAQGSSGVQGGQGEGTAEFSTRAMKPRAEVAIEQFDAESAGHLIFGYSDGWHEPEYNPVTGRIWRWTSERAVVRVVGAAGRALALKLSGEVEAAARSRVTIRVAGQVVAEHEIGRQFLIAETLPAGLFGAGEAEIVIETDQTFVPAERSWRFADRRRLGLKVFECQVTPVS